MVEFKTLTFCELRQKEVVNVLDGKRLGRIVDIIFEGVGKCCVKGIVVPLSRKLFFLKDREIFIPWKCIKKIGKDVILVNLLLDGTHHDRDKKKDKFDRYRAQFDIEDSDGDDKDDDHDYDHDHAENHQEQERPAAKTRPQFSVHNTVVKKKTLNADIKKPPFCDKKCEKCMLFDCEHRWK